jgi:hypothetical protein
MSDLNYTDGAHRDRGDWRPVWVSLAAIALILAAQAVFERPAVPAGGREVTVEAPAFVQDWHGNSGRVHPAH